MELLPERHLGPDLPQGGRPTDAVAAAQAPDLLRFAAVDDDHPVKMPGITRFDRQGRLNDEDAGPALSLEPSDGLALPGQDKRVDELVEEAAGGRIGEDDSGQRGPVDRPVRAKDGRTEPGSHLLPGGPPGTHQIMGGLVGRIDDAAIFSEDLGDDGFPAGDPPGQGDPEDAISFCRSS